jgi:uncharacterized protein YbjT (DUF2867 family)
MSDDGAVVVLGATGRQGGATARRLLDRGRHVHALVRDPADPAAAALAGLGAELVQADLDDPASLRAAMTGVEGVFLVLPYQPDRPDREVAQGTAVAATFGRVLGRPVRYVAMPYDRFAQFDPNLATLGAWLDREGYRAAIPALRRLHPGLLTLEAWLPRAGWAADARPVA